MLEGPNVRKDVVTLFQPNVSIAFGKQSENLALPESRTTSQTSIQASEHVHSLFALSVASS